MAQSGVKVLEPGKGNTIGIGQQMMAIDLGLTDKVIPFEPEPEVSWSLVRQAEIGWGGWRNEDHGMTYLTGQIKDILHGIVREFKSLTFQGKVIRIKVEAADRG